MQEQEVWAFGLRGGPMLNKGDLAMIMETAGVWSRDQDDKPLWVAWPPVPVFGLVESVTDGKVKITVKDLTGGTGKPLWGIFAEQYVTKVMSADVLASLPQPAVEPCEDEEC